MLNWLKTHKAALVNFLAFLLLMLQAVQGQSWIDPKLQAFLVVVVNGAINMLGGPVTRMQSRRMAAKRAKRMVA